jgi:hypothetical protein
MVDNTNETSQLDDEPILCVRYTTALKWLARIVMPPVVFLLFYAIHLFLLREDYLRALIVAVPALTFLVGGIDTLLTKHILFYRNRITKVWYFLGQKTIPYARAKLRVFPAYMRNWPGWRTAMKSFSIVEVDDKGRDTLIQFPISYSFVSVAPATRKAVEAVLTYLLDIPKGWDIYETKGFFAKCTLPKEVIWHQ